LRIDQRQGKIRSGLLQTGDQRVVDDTDAYIQAGVQGLGLIRIASYLAQPYLQSGAPCMRIAQSRSSREKSQSMVRPVRWFR
jgi:DNA-binding transcriptional LysR family regulator